MAVNVFNVRFVTLLISWLLESENVGCYNETNSFEMFNFVDVAVLVIVIININCITNQTAKNFLHRKPAAQRTLLHSKALSPEESAGLIHEPLDVLSFSYDAI